MFIFYFLLISVFSDLPKLNSWVNDYANIISSETKTKLKSALYGYEKETGNQIFVLTVESISPYATIEDYSIAVAEKWKAGAKGVDNGVIIVIAPNERKVRIEVGYGLEGKLPDIIAGRIIKDHMLPYFKESNYDDGIKAGVYNVVKYIGTQKLSASNIKRKKKTNPLIIIVFLLMFVGRIFIFPFFGFFGGRGGGGSFGGFGGGGGGSFGGGGASGSW